ncbi:serine/threonine protein phosphatase PP2A-associated protein [Flagelloscypha sp. PMI_526]|nr:serine/threonine protein phosphatase PP2A-associated protein [Flagelloscypha sp. PMI_526]
MSDLNLPSLFARSLTSTTKALSRSALDDATQDLITSALKDLALVHARIEELALFKLQGRVTALEARQAASRPRILTGLGTSTPFVRSLENAEIVTPADRALVENKPSTIRDPSKRREVKIAQYKAEKDIKARIETLRKRRGYTPSPEPISEVSMILSLLPSAGQSQTSEEPTAVEDLLRESTILVLRLCYTQAYAQIESIEQELELLKNAPPMPPENNNKATDNRETQKQLEEDMWKLDVSSSSKGPLLDNKGKPLRPFTILPSGAFKRAQFQSEVFAPGYNLPTMTIDEYLQIEQERGNFITGGGPASLEQPTTSEQLALDSEQDGTAFGADKEEQKRQKDESWAQFTDANPRGAGNTMNRG